MTSQKFSAPFARPSRRHKGRCEGASPPAVLVKALRAVRKRGCEGSISETSFPYVARWADGDVDLVRRTAERVLGCARSLLEAIGAGATGEDASAVPVDEEV